MIKRDRTREEKEEEDAGIERDPPIQSDINKRDHTEDVVEDGMETDLGIMKDGRGGRGNLSLKWS